MILDIDPNQIDFSNSTEVKEVFLKLLNTYANSQNVIFKLREENQILKDEINKLKGEKGKPDIKLNKKNDEEEDEEESFDQETKKKKKRNRNSKKPNIKIDREEIAEFSEEKKKNLPLDVEFKGYREVIIQEVKIVTDNVKFKILRYWSSSTRKTYEPNLPEQYNKGEFGAHLHAFVLMLYFIGRVTENKIVKILKEVGIIISPTKVLDIINGNEDDFSKEKIDILNAGLTTTSYQQTDDTGIRINAVNHYMNVYCNPFYTAFKINENKKRETIRKFLNGLKSKILNLVSDDAPQFKEVTESLALCWVHEERHYKKLNPILTFQKKLLTNFRGRIWEYYDKLKEYKQKPTEKIKIKLNKEFDKLFSTITGYEELDHRIELTRAKKENLLVVLDHPEVPLHNNASEQEIREIVVKRKVSNGLRSEKGKLAWENHFTILGTCRKQGISYWEYLKNRFCGIEQMLLAERVASHAITT